MAPAVLDDRFLSVLRRDLQQWPLRMALAAGMGVLLAAHADWRVALGWVATAMAFEEVLRRVSEPLVADDAPAALPTIGVLVLQFLITATWSAAGVILWLAGGPLGQATAMSFFAALLFHVATQRIGSRLLLIPSLPALATPLFAVVLWPQADILHQGVLLILTGLAAGQAGRMLVAGCAVAPGPFPAPRPAPAPRRPSPITAADGDLSFEALAEAKAEAEAANHAKSAFLAIMSHEIRTPLNGILGMTQALAADPALSPAQLGRLTVIRESGQSLLAILNDILDLSKVEAGKLELESIEFDLADLVRGAHDSFSALAAQKGLDCRLRIDPAARGTYLGDPTRLRQILYNLISNALKFTEEGEVHISIATVPGGLRMTVEDTGAGIEPAQLERLFRKFEQADPSSTRRYGGTGLGLAICRDLCALMGGAIHVESELGRGSRFLVTLPLVKVRAAAPQSVIPGAAEPQAPEDAGALRVLAAEDNPTNQQVLMALLGPAGVEATMVDDGEQAVEAWASGGFDLILMDIQMPRMDGLTATRTIRAREAELGRPRTPIIALTANAMSHQVEEYLAAGMDGFVPKPIDLRALYEAIQAVQAAPSRDASLAAIGR
ncbi:ATP-binding protein [Phenylobacterium sp.]|uniref:ATP-binding protein n=1 Tax=Phenylobacterium sp. TaxID=1871053 RepID=UPI002ED79F52